MGSRAREEQSLCVLSDLRALLVFQFNRAGDDVFQDEEDGLLSIDSDPRLQL